MPWLPQVLKHHDGAGQPWFEVWLSRDGAESAFVGVFFEEREVARVLDHPADDILEAVGFYGSYSPWPHASDTEGQGHNGTAGLPVLSAVLRRVGPYRWRVFS